MATDPDRSYPLHSDRECERLELQAEIAGIADHLRHLDGGTPDAVLDAGCGSGSMTRLLAARYPNARIVGVDVMPPYLDDARARAARDGLTNIAFEQGDARDLGFADGSFDLVWSKYLLYFLARPQDALRSFRRVLRPGGVAVIVLNDWARVVFEPDPDDFRARMMKVAADTFDMSLLARLPAMLKAAGFVDISVSLDTDRVYTSVGRAGPRMRGHLAMEVHAARAVIAAILGGPAACDAFIADYLDYFDRDETAVVLPLWVVKAHVPNLPAAANQALNPRSAAACNGAPMHQGHTS